MKKILIIICAVAFVAFPRICCAQFSSVSVNTLGYLTGNLNVALDFKINSRTTFDIPLSFSPMMFNKLGWQNVTVQPGFRFWTNEIYQGSFFGLYAGGTAYRMLYRNNYYQGWASGVGFSFGHSFLLSKRWNLEAEIGASLIYADYTKKENRTYGIFEDEHWTRHRRIQAVPSKLKISFGYIF